MVVVCDEKLPEVVGDEVCRLAVPLSKVPVRVVMKMGEVVPAVIDLKQASRSMIILRANVLCLGIYII